MANNQYFNLKFNNKEFKLDKTKLMYILSCLESKKTLEIDDNNLQNYLDKYGLLNEKFLENINDIKL